MAKRSKCSTYDQNVVSSTPSYYLDERLSADG